VSGIDRWTLEEQTDDPSCSVEPCRSIFIAAGPKMSAAAARRIAAWSAQFTKVEYLFQKFLSKELT